MKPPAILAGLSLVLLALGGSLACSDDEPAGPGETPQNHTVIRGGVAHAPGLNDPSQNCTSCHGPDLQGGPNGQPSCFTCHGQKWP